MHIIDNGNSPLPGRGGNVLGRRTGAGVSAGMDRGNREFGKRPVTPGRGFESRPFRQIPSLDHELTLAENDWKFGCCVIAVSSAIRAAFISRTYRESFPFAQRLGFRSLSSGDAHPPSSRGTPLHPGGHRPASSRKDNSRAAGDRPKLFASCAKSVHGRKRPVSIRSICSGHVRTDACW